MGNVQRYLAKLKELLGNRLFKLLLFLLVGVFSYIMMVSNVTPEKINVELLQPAEQTIRATKTVEDTYQTELEKDEVAKQVPDAYTLKKEYAQNKVDLISSIFDSGLEVKKEIEDEEQAKESIPEQAESLKEKLTEEVANDLSDSVFTSLVKASEQELRISKDLTITVINKVMTSSIPSNEVENAKRRAEEDLKLTSLTKEMKRTSIELARYAIIQNYFFDQEKTEEQRRKVIESVEPVKILQGQIIVEEGQLVDREIYRQLELAGFLNAEDSVLPFLGLALFIFVVMGGFYYYFRSPDAVKTSHSNQMLIFIITFMITLGTMKIISMVQELKYGEISFFFPIAMAIMLVRILLNERYAIAMAVILAGFGTILFNVHIPGNLNFSVGLYFLLSGISAIIILSKRNFQAKLLQAGLLLSGMNIVILFAILLITNGHYSEIEYLFYVLGAGISGIASSILTIGLLPFFEAGFGILSSLKLIELSNPNHPLLRKILTDAPGTYHHSVMVANLAESACEAIGANGLLARVGCYYHDIGKTRRPQFFIENQLNQDNPHDKLPPGTSKDIIIAHAVDGADMLRKAKFPNEIVDIAEQHHGTTLLKYFYHKVCKDGTEINEADYRYPGPKAQTKEIAVIGIADSVEAAVRSMNHPTQEKIEELVKQIINDRIHDKQFAECDITMRELSIVQDSLCESLHGIFHSRIEYPELSKLEQKVKA
ncbi:HD family phosphohydrolase [Peribacillus psychrosaccharolyticus]|uniref:HD family phosphohydrolase n=1 Tax=Peribacillus psychrosaccharolyticus TaxID=1407 RepID=UPI003D27496D